MRHLIAPRMTEKFARSWTWYETSLRTPPQCCNVSSVVSQRWRTEADAQPPNLGAPPMSRMRVVWRHHQILLCQTPPM